MDGNTVSTTCRTFRAKLLSVLLAVLMLFTSIPAMFPASASGSGGSGNPIVLTNASVEFRDMHFKEITDTDSGEIFYLMAKIGGNNVEEGEVDSYRIEISDKNLLLPNFAGNGFKDGAVYNGYTLHVNSDGSRYITFQIDNGETKQIRLQAKFQNGKTANGTVVKVKLTQESSGKSVSNQITADAAMQWSASKGENRTSLKAQEIAKGTTVNYTLSASPNNASKKTGAEWVQSLKFEDTISLENMTFLGDAKAAIQNAVKAAIQTAGYDAEPTVTVNDGKADISFALNSRNENAEMPAVNLNVALPLNSNTVKMNGTADGKVTNSLTVSGKPYGDNTSYSTIGGNSVELKVSAPQGPKFSIGKTVQNGKAYYVNGDTVEFEISASNTGDAAGDITLTDTVPDGMTLESITAADGTVSGNNVTFQNVAAGATVTAKVVCKVSKDQTANLTNEVTDGKNTAKATISVKEDKAVIETPVKSGYVTYNDKNLGQKYYPHIAGQTATYTISVTNSGAKDAKDVLVSDDSLSDNLENMTYTVDGVTKSAFPGKIDVPAGKTVQITVTGTIKNGVNEKILNVATVDGKSSNEVKFTPDTPKAQLGITKRVDKATYVAGDELTYTIVVENSGSADANGVTFSDVLPDTLENVTATTNVAACAVKLNGNTIESDSIWNIAPGESVTITITGTVKAGTTEEITNHAQYTYEGKTTKSNEVKTTKDTSGDYKAEKWIVDASGNVLVDASSDPASDFKGFSLGDTVTYRARFTNNSGAPVDKVGFYDFAIGFNLLDNGTIRIYDGETGTLLKTVPRQSGVYSEYGDGKNPLDWSKGWLYDNTGNNAGHYPKMRYLYENANLANGKSLIFEYDMKLSRYETIHAGQQISGNLSNENDVYFKANGLAGDSSNGSYDAKAYVKPKLDVTFETVKSVGGSEGVSSNNQEYAIEDAAKLSDDVFFQIQLNAHTLDTVDYTDAVFTIKDKLPDGMHWDSSYTTGTWGWNNALKLNNLTLVSEPVEENGVLTFQVKPTTDSNGKLSYNTSITYAAKFTDEKIAAMQGVKKSVVTNTVTEITVTKDGDTLHEIKPNAQATVTFTQKVPAPGFAKLAVASYAGKDYTNADLQKVENGYITAGDTLIWQAVLYNGKGETTSGKATLNGEELGKLDLTDVTLTDNLPGCYEFDNTSYPTKYFVVPLKADGSFAVNEYGMVTVTGHAIQTAVNGDSVSWDVSSVTGTGVTEGKLEPNYAIVVQFATTVKDGQEKEGVITNTGYAEVTQPFTAEDTVAGEKRDTQIWNYANYNIVGLTTESWKTITYTNNGHNRHTGDPHTDPATDTGYSREPTHNYVQGMQGEDVTYELHIKNNSPVDLENMTIIDRLPYVGDLGLVSGYARNSAFGVKLKSIDSVMVGGTKVTANAAYSYSTDKTSVLNEYSKDWLGQNDVMNWTNIKSDDTVNFRIQLQDTTVKVGEEVVVKVTATVPSYVAKTGEENIAWNSFAYSYQNPDILGDTVMVAEPAKVGVWVQTPDTTVDVTVNKTLATAETKDATFYFALFTDENYTTRLSDVISVTIPAGQNSASVTMKDVDLSSIKQQTNNANNVYLLETDAKGNQIHNYTPTYTGNEISTDATTNQTVGVTNTKNTGEITLTKTLAGVEGGDVTGDTFYFALFTKNAADDYVRYEEAPVQSLTFTEAGSQDVTFEDVPKGMDFYVLETNANGVPTYTGDSGTYTADSGIRYSFLPVTRSAVQAGGTTTITNFEQTQYSITVSKVLIADDVKSTPVFSVGLFTKNGNDYTQVGTTKNVTAGSDVTFDGLKADTPYYIFEMDGDKRVENGASFQMPVVLDPKNSTAKTDTTFYVSYDCCDKDGKVAALTLTKDAPNASTIITNSTDNPTKITVTKIATEDGKPAVDHAIKVGLFTLNADGNYQEVSGQKKTITIAAGDKGKKSVTFDGLDSSKTYYVFELDAEGNRVENGGTTEVSKKTFVASYSGGNMVAMDVGIPGAKTITDTYNQDVKLSFAKTDVDGKAMTGYKLTLTKPDGNEESWTTDGTAKVFTNLTAGKYTLTEAAQNNYVPVDVTFEIGDDGYIVTENAESMAYAVLEKTGVTVINRAQVSVDKQDIANSKELAGAVIKITRTDGGLNESVLEVKRGDTALTKETSLDESDYSKYTFSKNELTFISDGKTKTDIIGLPDGTYIMEEVVAPDGYNKVKTTFTFTIDKGQVTQTSAVSEEYGVSGNDIVMKDSAKKTISISKQAVGGGEELTGAVLKLTAPAGTDLSKVKGSYSDGSTAGIETSGNTITWTSDNAKGGVTLANLPAGVYTLEETTAPDGFTKKTEEMNFEVGTDGKVGTVNGLTKDDNKVVMEDAASKLTIAKKDITGKQEVTGAKLTLTLTKADESGATLNDVTVENNKNITVDSRTAESITWISGKTDAVLSKLPDGEYTLKETGGAFTDTETGKTYTVIESTMTFTVENGVITKSNAADNLNDKATEGYYYYDKTKEEILVCDAEAVNIVPISKQDAGSGAEVAGATLEITAENVLDTTKLELSRTDKNGNKTVLVKGTDYSISADGKTIQFVSGEDATIITGLPAGSYQLKETNAPDGYQLYTAEETFTIGTDGKVTGTTTIQDEVSKLTIAKKDITGQQEVTGATLTLKLTKPDESGATLDDVTANVTVDSRTADSITWTSGKTDAILSKLPDGEYTLKETGGAFTDTETGKTYTVIKSTMTFTVENGVVTSTTGDADNLNDKATEGYYYYDKTAGQILVCDAEAVNVVPISKQDAGSGAEVAGATLEITAENVLDTTKLELSRTDKNGNKTVLVKDRDYSISTDGKTIQFVSGEDVTIITGLPAGSYQLKETNAPDGYQLYTAEETFTIGTDGKVTGTTTIQDKVSKLTIAKKDITGKQEVTGAKLTLTLTNPDESGATLDGVKANITVDSRDAKSITWTSGKTDAILSKLPDGKYTLKETGGAFTDTETGKTYTVIESTMTFTVENGVITKSNAADNLNDKATEGYYYYDKTKEEILVCDAEQPAITTTSTSETTTTSTTTTPTRTSATTGSSTETTVSTTSATPTDTTTSTTKTTVASTDTTTGSGTVTTVSTTASTAGPTHPTTTSTTGSGTVTTVSTTASTAGPTQPTTTSTTGSGTVTTASTTESTAGPTQPTTTSTTGSGTVTTVSTTASTAGPTQPTTTSTTGSGTVTTVSTTASTAGPTQPTTTSATATNTTTTTSSTGTGSDTGTTTTTQSATTVTATNTGSVTETTPIVTVTETAPVTTTTCSTIQTTETTPTTVTTVTTPVTTVTTTELERGVLIRKCDMGGNEIAGASLQVADLDGNVIDAWISEAGISHAIETVEVGVPYCLTELQAPVDYALAESIYFRLEEDGTVTILTFAVNEDGTIATDENGPIILTETPSADAVVTMFDEFIGIVTTTDITTETTTTTETETTTTTPHNTTNDNGNHTPSASETTSSGETTTETTNGSGTTTTGGSGTTTTTRYRSSSGSSSSSSSGRGNSSVRVSSTPKTDDRIWMLLFPTGLALTGAILTGRKRKKKHQK